MYASICCKADMNTNLGKMYTVEPDIKGVESRIAGFGFLLLELTSKGIEFPYPFT